LDLVRSQKRIGEGVGKCRKTFSETRTLVFYVLSERGGGGLISGKKWISKTLSVLYSSLTQYLSNSVPDIFNFFLIGSGFNGVPGSVSKREKMAQKNRKEFIKFVL